MNYQEYNWAFDSKTAPKLKTAADMAMSGNIIDPWAVSGGSGLLCVGEDCCSTNQIWDASQNKCLTHVEGMENMDFLNQVFSKYSTLVQNQKPDVVL
jgi:hypothetical protein